MHYTQFSAIFKSTHYLKCVFNKTHWIHSQALYVWKYMTSSLGKELFYKHTFYRHESFQFFNWFSLLFWSPMIIFMIDKNIPKCSIWVFLFRNCPGGIPLQNIFSYFHHNPFSCLFFYNMFVHHIKFIINLVIRISAMMTGSVLNRNNGNLFNSTGYIKSKLRSTQIFMSKCTEVTRELWPTHWLQNLPNDRHLELPSNL